MPIVRAGVYANRSRNDEMREKEGENEDPRGKSCATSTVKTLLADKAAPARLGQPSSGGFRNSRGSSSAGDWNPRRPENLGRCQVETELTMGATSQGRKIPLEVICETALVAM
ncbi:hypothetical protein F1880_009137 [Penicillium rolfsii]|nr:hypothetical protein F1880_009137 [Penicillium rolfsii]